LFNRLVAVLQATCKTEILMGFFTIGKKKHPKEVHKEQSKGAAGKRSGRSIETAAARAPAAVPVHGLQGSKSGDAAPVRARQVARADVGGRKPGETSQPAKAGQRLLQQQASQRPSEQSIPVASVKGAVGASGSARRRSLVPRQVPTSVRAAAEEASARADADAGHRRTDSASSSSIGNGCSSNTPVENWAAPQAEVQLLRVARIAARSDEARRKLVEREAIPFLVSALRDAKTSDLGKSHAAFALAELSVLEELEEKLVRADAPSALIGFVRSVIPELATATRTTTSLVECGASAALGVLLSTLASATRALRNLTAGSPRTAEGMVRLGVIPALVQVLSAPQVLVEHEIMQGAMVEATGAFGNIAQEPPCALALVKAKCIKAILRYIDAFRKPAERAEFNFHVASIIAELSLQSGAVHDYLIDIGVFPALARLIASELASGQLWHEFDRAPSADHSHVFRASDTIAEACRAFGNLGATARGRAAARNWPLVTQTLCRFIEQCEQRQATHYFESASTNPLADACRALANLCLEAATARVAASLSVDLPLLSILELAKPAGELSSETRRALIVLARAGSDIRQTLLTHLRQCSIRSVQSGRSEAALIDLRSALVRSAPEGQRSKSNNLASVAVEGQVSALAPLSLKCRPLRPSVGAFQSTGRTVTMRPLANAQKDHFYTVDTFELGQVLGRGGYGVVYMARNVRTNEIVAIKSFHAVDSGQTLYTVDPRAFKEQRLWQRLRHENIVEYKGSFIGEKGDLNLVIEYVDGWSLAEHLAQFNEFHEPLVREITRQVLHGLRYLHSHGVTHRDLKPGNIMVNQNGMVKITDFGVSSCVDLQTAGSGHTMVGTPWYIAPEMIEGRPYDHSVDIWSLGCTVLELATGRRPYHTLNAMAALFRMVQDRMPPIPPNLSAECASFLKACWVWEPSKRPSAADLLKHPFVRLEVTSNSAARV